MRATSFLLRGCAVVLAPAALLVAGCGGGASSPDGPAPGAVGRKGTLARFNVDVRTGKVTITRESESGSRAVLTGGAVSFDSSDLLSVGGDSGKRLLRITIANNTREGSLHSARLVIGNLSNTAAVDYKAATATTTQAGSGTAGSADGYRTAATFNGPTGIAAGGPSGSDLWVADRTTHILRKVHADGTVQTLAGSAGTSGAADGVGAAARFNVPWGVAVDSSGNAFVADSGGHRIRRVTPLGEVTTIAGTGTPGSTDGAGNVATFNSPKGIAVTPAGDQIWVSDTGTHLIRSITWDAVGPRNQAASYSVNTIAGGGAGFANGDGTAARFNNPVALAAVGATSFFATALVVVDRGNHAIRWISDPTGAVNVTTIAGTNTAGTADGVGPVARFNAPNGIALVQDDEVEFGAAIISESGADHRLRALIHRPGSEPAQAGNYEVVTLAGAAAGFADGNGVAARFSEPNGLCVIGGSVSTTPTFYLADAANNRIRKVVVSSGSILKSGGPGSAVAEPVRLVNWDTEVPEPGKSTWSRELSGAEGAELVTELQFFVPSGVSGFTFTAYVEADTDLVNLPAVGAAHISTVAGGGGLGAFDGLPKSARFSSPVGIAAVPLSLRTPVSGGARAYITDFGNHRIRTLLENGRIGTLTGGRSGFADGPLNTAQFSQPAGIGVGPDGTVYVADSANRRVRRISPAGIVTTIAGTGVAGDADGAGNVATFSSLRGLAVDSGGAVYVTDVARHVVRRITYEGGDPALAASWQVVTVAGSPGAAGSADGAGAAARFNAPWGIAADADGRLYVADYGNHIIRVLTRAAAATMNVTTIAGTAGAAGTTDATGAAARFNNPIGVAVDPAHNLYIVDRGNNRIRRISPLGEVRTVIGSTAGFTDGAAGQLNGPYFADLESKGTLLVADGNNHAIRAIHRVLSDGQAAGL